MKNRKAATAARSSRAMWQGLALIGLPALVAVALLAYNATAIAPQLVQDQRRVQHTLDTIAAARTFDLAVGNAESAERGFIITGDDTFLGAYKKSTLEMSDRLDRLRRLSVDNPEQQRRLALIQSASEDRLTQMQSAISARQNKGFIDARRIVQSHLGQDTRRVISGLVTLAVESEYALLAGRQAKLAESQRINAEVDAASIALVTALWAFGVFLLVRAVERERRSFAQLRESEERFRLLVSGVQDYAIVMLDAEGRAASWNTGAERIYGYRPVDILAKSYSTFFAAEDREAGVPSTELAQAAHVGSVEVEGWRARRDGTLFYANATVTALRDSSGKLQGYAKITRDVTERRAQQQALDESRAALAQAQKMESLGQLTGGIAHDFNNLLTVIIGSIDLVLRKRAEGQKALDLLDAARQAGKQGAALVQRLLAFSRRQALAPQDIDVNRLVGGMSELIRRTLGENVIVETVLGASLWRASVDPGQLESALLNLAINARDAMAGHGKLTIETGNTFLDREYAAQHSETAPGDYVVIAVSDTGAGMPKEIMERAFEPFFTTKGEGKGTGLGLSQVHGFVKQSGGHVALTSEAGRGTTVYMYLPRLAAEIATERRELSPPEPPASANGETVLLVEDEPLVRMYSNEVLTGLGYRVLEAGDGKEALRVLAEHDEIRVMFTDLGLPGGMNGKRLAEEARTRVPALKILFVTGYAKSAVLNQGVLETGVELLEKPYTVNALAQKLRQLSV